MDDKQYFVSYNKADKKYAKWIAAVLESNGYSIHIQAWDIRPSDDFILRMNAFIEHSKGFIGVFSENYFNSDYCNKEWAAAFDKHINNNDYKFFGVKIKDIKLPDLLRTTVYINISKDLDREDTNRLLNAINPNPIPREYHSSKSQGLRHNALMRKITHKYSVSTPSMQMILIVGEDNISTTIISETIEAHGYLVCRCKSIVEAKLNWKDFKSYVSAILIDNDMPSMGLTREQVIESHGDLFAGLIWLTEHVYLDALYNRDIMKKVFLYVNKKKQLEEYLPYLSPQYKNVYMMLKSYGNLIWKDGYLKDNNTIIRKIIN